MGIAAVRLGALILLLAVVGGTVRVARPRAAGRAHVMIIGDSVATGMSWHPSAIAVMQRDLDVDWEVEICRTITGISCPFDGERPPTLVDLVSTLGRVPAVVVVEMGYNDPAPTFAAAVDEAMSTLVASGAEHVLWLTLRAARAPYPTLNALLGDATTRWPQLELVDWDRASSAARGWFQSDGVHLLEPGGIAMAHLVHAAVDRIVDPLRVVEPPLLRAGRSYSLRLHAGGGAPPYAWSVVGGRPPRGFHLLANGRVEARLRAGAHAALRVAVRDADGASAVARLTVGADNG